MIPKCCIVNNTMHGKIKQCIPDTFSEEEVVHRRAREIGTEGDAGYEETTGNDIIILSNTVPNTRKPIEGKFLYRFSIYRFALNV